MTRTPPPGSIAAWRASFLDLVDEPDAYAADLAQTRERADDGSTWITAVDVESLGARVRSVAARLLADGPAALPLAGVPYAVKDNIDVAGLPTTAGCPRFGSVPAASAPVVERLDAAGAICLGKTNLDQFATGLVGTRSPYGTPRNVIDARLVPGGSSSGSAVTVAAGAVAFALGTDTAGSGRVPAAMNGIVGLKPRTGVLPSSGVIPAVASLDCVSVFARTVGDADAVLRVLAGAGWTGHAGTVRVGVPDAASLAPVDAATRLAWHATVDRWIDAGVEVHDVDLAPFFAVGDLLYGGPWVAERDVAVGAFIDDHPDDVDPVVRETILASRSWSAADAFRARDRLRALAHECTPTWATVDVLAVPTVPRPVTIDEVRQDPVGVNAQLGRYTNFVNLLGLAALAVPGTARGDGRPTGVSLLAPEGLEPALVTAAELLVSPEAGAVSPASASPSAALPVAVGGPGIVRLAVVGAHLAGLPLNERLTSRGAQLVDRTTTAPTYRLWALDHLDPPRPALERVAEGGACIEVEVWSLDHAALGAVVSEVASPLAIGTVELVDGRWVTGFVCEPAGLGDAREITELGGWRAYLGAQDATDARADEPAPAPNDVA